MKFNSVSLLSKKEEYKLIKKWQTYRDNTSLDKIIRAYIRMPEAYARKFSRYGLPKEDLVNEGVIGIMHALDKFDLKKNLRLATYASWWIRAAMQDYILKNWSIVRMASTAKQKSLFFGLNRIKKLIAKSSNNIISDIKIDDIAKSLKVKDKIVIIGSGSASANSQGGIAIISGSSSTNKALVIGRIANDTWGVGKQDVQDGAVTSLTGMSLVNMRASKYEIDGATNYLDVDTDLKIVAAADITLDPGGGDINADGNILPNADNTRNLGSASKRWANIYTGDLHLRNDKGDWTIVEESDMLIVRNNLTGKNYKMMLEPIEENE